MRTYDAECRKRVEHSTVRSHRRVSSVQRSLISHQKLTIVYRESYPYHAYLFRYGKRSLVLGPWSHSVERFLRYLTTTDVTAGVQLHGDLALLAILGTSDAFPILMNQILAVNDGWTINHSY